MAQAPPRDVLPQGVRQRVPGSVVPHALPSLLPPEEEELPAPFSPKLGQAALRGQEATSLRAPAASSSHQQTFSLPWPVPLPRQQ